MKTLYVSDLDGTLLNNSQKLSGFTKSVINNLAENDILFSYATARSYSSAHKAADGIMIGIPLIVYNGTFIVNNLTGERLVSNYFNGDIVAIIKELIDCGINPIVYSIIDGKEKFSYIKSRCNESQNDFIKSRQGDDRDNPVNYEIDLLQGSIFYISCIDRKDCLEPFYNKYKDEFNCLFQKDIYSDYQWLEFMPEKATKANAILNLKEMLCCDRVVAFGDGINDVPMFRIADECYAVSNAADELKCLATGVIAANNDDGVAKWLVENVNSDENS